MNHQREQAPEEDAERDQLDRPSDDRSELHPSDLKIEGALAAGPALDGFSDALLYAREHLLEHVLAHREDVRVVIQTWIDAVRDARHGG